MENNSRSLKDLERAVNQSWYALSALAGALYDVQTEIHRIRLTDETKDDPSIADITKRVDALYERIRKLEKDLEKEGES